MNTTLHLFIWVPIFGFLVSLLLPKKNETLISVTAFCTLAIQLSLATVFVVYWLFTGAETIQIKDIVLFKNEEYVFQIDFLFDKITAVYLLVGAILTFMVTLYSRYYLHREAGYKRFFNTTLFFYVGYCLTTLSGNLETLFIGWEILGISSFLLISFYRERYLPVKNAVKVFSIYRIGDVGIILAMWASHHLWGQNITFFQLNNAELVHEHLQTHSIIGVFISLMFLLSASAKSAQLPFSSWLPRAMEGPTPSSAIFYGSLSVHIGAFLLMRTFPFWEFQTSVRILIVVLGFITTIITTGIARVQSSVKSQIAYASIAQIGLIFVEIAFGLENLALIHILGNAFLRTYQLLISPSIVSHKIREQLYQGKEEIQVQNGAWQRFQRRIYLLNLKEWNLDHLLYRFIWNPLKKIGRGWKILNFKYVFWVMALVLAIGLFLRINESMLTPTLRHKLPFFFAFWGFLIAVKAFTERDSVRKSFTLIMFNHVSISLALSFNEHFDHAHHIWYLSGVVCAWAVGYYIMTQLRKKEWVSLDNFYGHIYEYPKTGFVFLLVCLSLAGFPITPSFVGEDLIFSHIHLSQIGLAFFTAFSLVINGLATMRIYARVFLGPHIKTYHQIAKRSS